MTDEPMAALAVSKTPVGRISRARIYIGRLVGDAGLRAWAQPVTFLGLGILAIGYAILAFMIVTDRDAAAANAVRHSDNIVRIINQSYSHIFQSVDSTLLFIRRAYLQSASMVDLQTWLDDPATRTDLGFYYVITNAQGRVVAATLDAGIGGANIIGLDVSEREYFQRQKSSPADELFFSAPIKMKISARVEILVTRRLIAADGTFAGIVAVALTPEALTRVGGELNLGPGGALGLIGFDGIIRARFSDGRLDYSRIGTQLAPDVSALGYAIRAPNGHFWTGTGTPDDVRRMVSYRTVGDYPMVATLSMTESEVFGHANRQAKFYWSIALLTTIVILLSIKWGVAREQKLIAATNEILNAQGDLRRSQDRYRLAEDAVNDAIWDWDIGTDYCYRSPRWKKIMGYGDHDQAPTTMAALVNLAHPLDRPVIDEAMRAHLEQDVPYSVEFRHKMKNGDYRWVQSRGKAQRNAEGKAVRMLGTITDITDRVHSEVSLKESRDNLARAERLALLGHFKSEIPANTLVWSDGVYSIFGLSPDNFVPTLLVFFQMVVADDRPALKKARDDVLAGYEIPNLVIRVRRPDGAILDIELWITPVRNPEGKITGVFGTIQDVTIRRRAEELLARANQELEARVSERTAELAHEMRRREEAQMTLGQMQKMEAVGQLTAGVAHDFNNLLAVIAGSLEFVDRAAAGGLTADPELIDAAMRATRRGRELVRRLLAFSRQTPLRAEPTPIDQMVLDTLRLLQRTLGQNIDLVTRLNAKGAVISVDRNQLANALLNLALNARDAMPEGGEIVIATECRPCDPALAKSARSPTGEEVTITITDNGTGMTEDVLSRAIEPFFTTKSDGLGSGLGLSMVQGFTEQSGGLLKIESKPRRGTSVTIRLPRISLPGQAEEEDGRFAGAGAEREKTVLLVEDDADVRIVASAQLRHLGYKVQAVANGMEAIDLLASPATIDIILTDIVLPGGLDGVSLVKEAMAARPGMGILCMSGYDPAQKHRKWLNMQNITFLEKPFNMQKLAQALELAVAQ